MPNLFERLAPAAASKPGTDNKELAAEPGNADQSESDEEDKDDDKKDDAKPATPATPAAPAAQAQPGQPGQQPQYFYMPNAQGQMTLMKTVMPNPNAKAAKPESKLEDRFIFLFIFLRLLNASITSRKKIHF